MYLNFVPKNLAILDSTYCNAPYASIIIVRIKGSNKDIGPWAMPEDAKELEDKQILVKASRLLGRGRGLVTTSR